MLNKLIFYQSFSAQFIKRCNRVFSTRCTWGNYSPFPLLKILSIVFMNGIVIRIIQVIHASFLFLRQILNTENECESEDTSNLLRGRHVLSNTKNGEVSSRLKSYRLSFQHGTEYLLMLMLLSVDTNLKYSVVYWKLFTS